MAKKLVLKEVKYKAVCVNCGVFIPEDSGTQRNGKYYCSNCAVLPPEVKPQPAPLFTAPTGPLKAICYILSLLPLIGFILGAIFYSQTAPETRKFGRNCLIMMAIGLCLMMAFFVLMVAAGIAIGGTAGALNFGEGYY